MGLKIAAILNMFGAMRTLAEKAPELAERFTADSAAAHAGGVAATAGGLATGLLPVAILGPAILEAAAKRYEGRAEPEALIELFRKTLLAAIEECAGILKGRPEVADADRALLRLWKEGLDR